MQLKQGSWGKMMLLVRVSALLLVCCVTWSEFLTLSGPQHFHLYKKGWTT